MLVIGLTIAGMLVLLYLISYTIVLRGFTRTEEWRVRVNVERTLKTLQQNIAQLNGVTGDWAIWDDTYKFVEDLNPDYIKRNIQETSFIELRLNVIIFVNSANKIVYSNAFDLEQRKEVPLPQILLQHLSPDSPLLKHTNSESSVSGLIMVPEGPLIIASRPILPSDKNGPIRGSLIFGRYLNDYEIANLADITNLSITVKKLSLEDLPADFKKANMHLASGEGIFIHPLNEETTAAYTYLKDIYNQPILILKVELPRFIYKQGKVSLRYFVFLFIVTGLLFVLTFLLTIDKLVLSDLSKIGKQLVQIGKSGDLSVRLPVQGGDELAKFATIINKMLENLAQAQQKLKESEEKYRTLVENVNIGVYRNTLDPNGSFTEANPAQAKMLGYDTVEEFLKVNVIDLYENPEDRKYFIEEITKNGFVKNKELRLRKRDGTPIWVSITAKAHYDSNGKINWVDGVIEDITERKWLEEELRALSLNDALTGLYNRRGFFTLAEQQLKIAQRTRQGLLLMFADLDGLKWINDHLGHQEGDRALVTVAKILKECFRSSDIIARLGGDEFAVLAVASRKEGTATILERLQKKIAEYNQQDSG
ncbi:MAG: diguanylate cyclase, partial [Candidatus Sumerlaeia bacterium]|nr:diguanylate cyclase [Candidatus Sumerlaeia bacterium]